MNKYSRWGVTAAAVLLVLCITYVLFPMTFYLNDDVTMRSILSGAYTGVPDGHAIYMKYPLTGLISLLYRMFGKVPWFSVFLEGFFWLSVTMVLEHLAHIAERIGKAGIGVTASIAFLCGALFLPHTIYLHYTIVAAVLGGCGLFLTATGGGKKAVLLFVLCYCVRSQMFFLLLPFLAVIYLWLLWEKRSRQLLVMPALLAVSILVCMAWNSLMYRSEDWRQYKAFNESRTQLYDYHDLLPYQDYAAQYESAGIGEWEYSILDHYTLALESSVDVGQLQAATDLYAAKRDAERNPSEYFRQCLIEYYYNAIHTHMPYNYILMCAYLLTVMMLLYKKKWVPFLLVCCMAVGRSLIWMFLIWKGRFPERIYISLYLLEIMVLAGMLCSMLTEQNNSGDITLEQETSSSRKNNISAPAVLSCTCILFSLLLFVTGITQMKTAMENVIVQQESQRKWNELTAYCAEHSRNLYLLDTTSMVSYSGEVWESTSEKANYLLVGGWMSAAPLLQERIQSLGAVDGGELLAKGTSGDAKILYIVSVERDIDWLFGYLSQRFDGIQVEQVDSIMLDDEELFHVYSVVN